MNQLHFINTNLYGKVAVSNNHQEYITRDEDNNIVDVFHKGLIIRWIPKGGEEPDIKVIKDIFINDFESDEQIAEWIDKHKILD